MTGEDSTFAPSDALSDLEVGHDSGFTVRLGTFDSWTGRINKDSLARAGFTNTGSGDKVECLSCGLKLLNWTPTDNPLREHAKRRQLCPFINSTYKQLRLNKPPKHPQYQELQARLDSFVGWPARYVPKTAEELSAAGFFYIGSADRVTCFQCGITLRDWEEEHDPVAEHRRYSEHCQFINNTDLDQLGVNTRNITSNSEQLGGACANVIDDNTTTERVTEQHDIGACGGDISKHQPGGTEVRSSLKARSPADNTTEVKDHKNQNKDSKDPNCKEQENVKVAGQPSEKQSCEDASTSRLSATQILANENKLLRARRTCKLCQKETVNTLFLPCGHLVTCSSCAPEVKDCMTCGKPILGTVKTYFV